MAEKVLPSYMPGQFTIVNKLIDEGVFDPRSKKLNIEQTETVVQEIADRSRANIVFENGSLEEGRDALRKAIRELVDSGVVDRSLALLIGRNLRPSGIVQSETTSYFTTNLDSVYGWGLMDTIGWGRIASRKGLESAGDELGISLPQETWGQIRQRADAGHEYGHGVEAGWERVLLEKEMGVRLGDNYSHEEWSELIGWAKYMVLDSVNDVSPLEETEVGELLELGIMSDQEKLEAQRERISMGFEMVTIKNSLIRMGVEEDKALAFRDHIAGAWRRGAKEMTEMLINLRQEGMGFGELSKLLGAVARILRLRGREDLAGIVRTRVNGIDLGYCYGLSEKEIAQWSAKLEEVVDIRDTARIQTVRV